MIKVLLLGLGRWGLNHVRNLQLPCRWNCSWPRRESKRLDPARKLGIDEAHLVTDFRAVAAAD